MDYINTIEASKRWNITTNRITILCKAGRISGAVQIGTRWFIPKNTVKPFDARTKASKRNKDDITPFRFFLFDFKDPSEFIPPLSNEEMVIRKGCLLFHECRFEEAEILFKNINVTNCNIYNKIFILFGRCMICTMTGKTDIVKDSYERLFLELQKDFPRKKELSFFPHEIEGALGDIAFFINDFKIDYEYSYHESFLPHLTYLSLISLLSSNKIFNDNDLQGYELTASFVDQTTHFVDAQTIHCYLGILYELIKKQDKTKYHISKFLEISAENRLYWLPALTLFYYPKTIEPILKSFSKDFYEKISILRNDIRKRFNIFSKKISDDNFFKILLSHDYIYVFYAIQGYYNKEIAKILDTTESYVNNRYSKIYNSLGVANKKELVDYYLQTKKHLF